MRVWRKRAALALTSVVTVGGLGVAYGLRDPGTVGYWRSTNAQDAYVRAYDRAFATLPTPTATFDLRTDFGVVRAYRFGPLPALGQVPVLLLPGRSSGVPMWSKNLPAFLEHHTVFAIDALADAGMSVQGRALTGAEDQATWVDEAISGLGLKQVQLVGHSFGGWNAANYAVRHPERVATLTLIEPVLVFAGLRVQMYLDTLPAALPFLPASWREAGLASIGGGEADPNDPIALMISAASAGFTAKLPPPTVLNAEERSRLKMPVYVALGGRSVVTDTEHAAATARELPNVTVRVWPEASHSLPMEVTDELQADLDQFLIN